MITNSPHPINQGSGSPSAPSKAAIAHAEERPAAEVAIDLSNCRNALSTYRLALFEDGDIVEVRRLPSKRSSWPRACQLPDQAANLLQANQTGDNVYLGANPRKAVGGTCAGDVALARSLFADLDRCTWEEAQGRYQQAGLPLPTVAVGSGHGVHLYWRLREPLTDLVAWTALQKRLIQALGADPKPHDPPRIMRAPGFLNLKAEPVPAVILDADCTRRYDLAQLADLLPPLPSADDQRGTAGQAGQQPPPPAELETLLTAARDDHVDSFLAWRIEQYLRECPVSVEHQDADAKLLPVVDALAIGYDLTDQGVHVHIQPWNDRCTYADGHPWPWSLDEIQRAINNVRAKSRRKPGYLLEHNMTDKTDTRHISSANGQASGLAQNDSSPKAPQGGGTIWKPVPISQLKRIAPPDTWVWEGILAPGKITLLSAEAKAGKTTLLSLLCHRMASGGSLCGANVYPGRVIVVSEEPADLWLDRRERLGLDDHLEILPMPFLTKPTQRDWEKMIVEAAQALKQKPPALVVWDTLSHLWWVPDENDNAKQATALMPLRQLSGTGTALALLHHFGGRRAARAAARSCVASPTCWPSYTCTGPTTSRTGAVS